MKTNFKTFAWAMLFAGIGANAQIPDQMLDEYATCTGGGLNNGISFGDSYYNTFFGVDAGRNVTDKLLGRNNTFIGHESGKTNTGGTVVDNNYLGSDNVFLGFHSGRDNSTGFHNTAIGSRSGLNLGASPYNVFVGGNSGVANHAQYGGNTMIGYGSGANNDLGTGNAFLGFMSGYTQAASGGSYNVFLGSGAGSNAIGSKNVYIGWQVGTSENASNRLLIDNENTSTKNALIWGDFNTDQLKFHGKVGIGGNSITAFGTFPTTAASVNVSNYNLFVKGGILTEELRVASYSNWADYVFAKDYELKPLSEVEKYIAENGHLPNVPSAEKIKAEGFEVADMARIQQEKIEELTLYLIQQQKEIEALKAMVKSLSNKE